MINHYVMLNAPGRLAAKLDFARTIGVSNLTVLVVPPVPAEELGRVHRLVAGARSLLMSRSLPFEVLAEEDALRHALENDTSLGIFDLDLVARRGTGLVTDLCTRHPKIILYGLRSSRRKQSAVFARGDANAAFAGEVLQSLSGEGWGQDASFVHVAPKSETTTVEDNVLEAFVRAKSTMPTIKLVMEYATTGIEEAIRAHSTDYGLMIFGLPSRVRQGSVTEHLLEAATRCEFPSTCLFVYARSEDLQRLTSAHAVVEPWILRNTFGGNEFRDIDQLVNAKKAHQLTVSLVLPALNEEKTVGAVIDAFLGPLMKDHALLDEIILMDSGSSDETRTIAAARGIPVYIHQQVRPDQGTHAGKGEAMWKSLFVTTGDIVAFVDTDLANPTSALVTGLVGPLLLYERLNFIKGFYRRPIRLVNDFVEVGGGRVTELTARPLLNLWFPELSGFFQPLAGTIAARSSVLHALHFMTGYGVELGHLVEYARRWGIDGIAQSELGEVIHRNQPLETLSKMAFHVLEAFFRLGSTAGTPFDADRMSGVLRQPFLSDAGFTMYQSELAQDLRPPVATLMAEAESQ
jgi:hypothetical protein